MAGKSLWAVSHGTLDLTFDLAVMTLSFENLVGGIYRKP